MKKQNAGLTASLNEQKEVNKQLTDIAAQVKELQNIMGVYKAQLEANAASAK